MRMLIGGLFLFGSTLFLGAADDFKPDPGFTSLFNGKDLTGWQLDRSKQKKDSESLDGKTEASGGRFKVENGMIVIDAKTKGDIYITTAKKFEKDVHIKFEYNPGPTCNNDLFVHGVKFDIKKADIKNLKDNDWNTFEAIVKGGKLEIKNNGESIKTFDVKGAGTGFTLRAEGGTIQYRKLQVKE